MGSEALDNVPTEIWVAGVAFLGLMVVILGLALRSSQGALRDWQEAYREMDNYHKDRQRDS